VNVTKDKIGKAGTGTLTFLPILLIMLFCAAALADEIIMQNGQNVPNAKVMRVGIDDIEYRIGEMEAIYVVRKSDVAKIAYDDGAEDIFEVPATAGPIQSEPETEALQLEAEATPDPAPEPVTAAEAAHGGHENTTAAETAEADGILAKRAEISKAAGIETGMTKNPLKPTFAIIGIGLGTGAIIYGIAENGKTADLVENGFGRDDYDKARRHAKNRNAAYTIGAAALLSGISIHIFF
jgi:hypothetical protein